MRKQRASARLVKFKNDRYSDRARRLFRFYKNIAREASHHNLLLPTNNDVQSTQTNSNIGEMAEPNFEEYSGIPRVPMRKLDS